MIPWRGSCNLQFRQQKLAEGEEEPAQYQGQDGHNLRHTVIHEHCLDDFEYFSNVFEGGFISLDLRSPAQERWSSQKSWVRACAHSPWRRLRHHIVLERDLNCLCPPFFLNARLILWMAHGSSEEHDARQTRLRIGLERTGRSTLLRKLREYWTEGQSQQQTGDPSTGKG